MAETFMTNQLMIKSKKYDELRKVTTGKGDDYTTGCLSKQKELDSDARTI